MEYGHRHPRHTIELDGTSFKEFRNAIVVSILVFLVTVALVLGYQGYRRQQASHLLHAFTTQLDAESAWMELSTGSLARRPYVDRIVTERVAGASSAACKARSGGRVETRYQRCRSGYDVTRVVREQR